MDLAATHALQRVTFAGGRDFVLGNFPRFDFALVGVRSVLDAVNNSRFVVLPVLDKFADALRIRRFYVGQSLNVARLSGAARTRAYADHRNVVADGTNAARKPFSSRRFILARRLSRARRCGLTSRSLLRANIATL